MKRSNLAAWFLPGQLTRLVSSEAFVFGQNKIAARIANPAPVQVAPAARSRGAGRAPFDSRDEHVRIWAGIRVDENADGEEAVVGDCRDTDAQIAPSGTRGMTSSMRPQQVERNVRPRHVGHDQVDEGLMVHEVAGRRDRRRRQGVEEDKRRFIARAWPCSLCDRSTAATSRSRSTAWRH